MDDAERQRTMDFILRQQAQFAAGSQKNEEKMETLKRVVVAMARQFRKDRADLKERVNALIDAQMRSEGRSEERQARTEEWQARAEERQARTEEWQARMEDSFARSDERMTRLEAEAERNSKEIAALLVSTGRNSAAIAKLTESNGRNSEAIARLAASDERNGTAIEKLTAIAADLARRRNDEGTA